MAEVKRKGEELPPAELARYGIPAKEPEGPQLVKGQEPESTSVDADHGSAL